MKTTEIISKLWDLLSPYAKKAGNKPDLRFPQHPIWANSALISIPNNDIEMFVAGSVRRKLWAGKPIPENPDMLHDVEIVAEAYNPLYGRLEELLRGKIIHHPYENKGWGDWMRKFVFNGLKFDLFFYDNDNRGFQAWLRTGPGDANTYAVKHVKGYVVKTLTGYEIVNLGAPFVIRGGYLWDKATCTPTFEQSKDERESWHWDTSRATKLSVPTEKDFLYLMGLGEITPDQRSEERYREIMTRRNHRWGDIANYRLPPPPPKPEQNRLF